MYLFLCNFKTTLERQKNGISSLGKSVFPVVILNIIILYDNSTDGLQNCKNVKIYASMKQQKMHVFITKWKSR